MCWLLFIVIFIENFCCNIIKSFIQIFLLNFVCHLHLVDQKKSVFCFCFFCVYFFCLVYISALYVLVWILVSLMKTNIFKKKINFYKIFFVNFLIGRRKARLICSLQIFVFFWQWCFLGILNFFFILF